MEIKSRERELRDIIQKNRLEGRERQRERERERERENGSKTGRVNLQMF